MMFIGRAKNKMDYVYVKDIVHIARQLEKSAIKNEDYILGSGAPVTPGKVDFYNLYPIR